MIRTSFLTLVVLGCLALAPTASAAQTATAHRDYCHYERSGAYRCPSDHASYKWRGWWCVRPGSEVMTPRFKKRIVFAAHTYWCHR